MPPSRSLVVDGKTWALRHCVGFNRVMEEAIRYLCGRWQDLLADAALDGQAQLVICDPIYESPDLSYLRRARELLAPGGSLYVFGDCSQIAPTKLALDAAAEIEFQNWVILGPQDWGGRSRRRWGQKHDDLLFYTRRGAEHTFNADEVSVPKVTLSASLNPSGRTTKIPNSVWSDVAVLSTMSHERVRIDGRGVRWQKPLACIERIVLASSDPGDLVIDMFAGVATVALACALHGRRCLSCEVDERVHRAGSERLAAQAQNR